MKLLCSYLLLTDSDLEVRIFFLVVAHTTFHSSASHCQTKSQPDVQIKSLRSGPSPALEAVSRIFRHEMSACSRDKVSMVPNLQKMSLFSTQSAEYLHFLPRQIRHFRLLLTSVDKFTVATFGWTSGEFIQISEVYYGSNNLTQYFW